jgi:hypothetical protein
LSQPDVARLLRDARPIAPSELRERVRLVAAEAAPPRRRLVTWRRALVVAAVVAAAAVAGVLATRSGRQQQQVVHGATPERAAVSHAKPKIAQMPVAAAVAPSTQRVERYSTTLELRVRDAAALSDASKRAVAIAHSLGGYEQRVSVDTARTSGYANLVLRIPKTHVQEAVRRLTALGTIVSENVQVQDLQGRLNATDRTIVRLQKQLADLRAQTQVERLQRGRASTVRSARYATIALQLTTRTPPAPAQHGHGPLHGLGLAFRWIGIGAIYAVALGGTFAALALVVWLVARSIRRRRDDALLSRS